MELNWNHMAEYLREVCANGRGEGEGGRSSADSHTHTAGWLWPWHWHRRGAWRTPGTQPTWLPRVHSYQAALGRNLSQVPDLNTFPPCPDRALGPPGGHIPILRGPNPSLGGEPRHPASLPWTATCMSLRAASPQFSMGSLQANMWSPLLLNSPRFTTH